MWSQCEPCLFWVVALAAPSFYLLVCRCCNVSLTHSLLSGSVYLVVVSFFVLSLLIFFGFVLFVCPFRRVLVFRNTCRMFPTACFSPSCFAHTHTHTHTHTHAQRDAPLFTLSCCIPYCYFFALLPPILAHHQQHFPESDRRLDCRLEALGKFPAPNFPTLAN